MSPFCFAYYCSGHGYGHATRVSAFANHLLALPEDLRPMIYIVSSAPERVFADSIANGAHYRYAEIDPVIVQPVAYRVDRRKSVEVLQSFLARKDALLEAERQWLGYIKATCVLSDAAFLGCLAAKSAGIPSVLITNFTFDSVYSYLATNFIDPSVPQHLQPSQAFDVIMPDVPESSTELMPLVEIIHQGYRCADLLLRLPGQIPIPSFSQFPSLPSPDWVDIKSNRFLPEVVAHLEQATETYTLYPPLLFPPSSKLFSKQITRKVIQAPLLVRPASSSIYSVEGRSRFLTSIGVPDHLHDATQTKILIVSFGGQVFRKPSSSRASSRASNASSRATTPDLDRGIISVPMSLAPSTPSPELEQSFSASQSHKFSSLPSLDTTLFGEETSLGRRDTITQRKKKEIDVDPRPSPSPILADGSAFAIPGAPPSSKRLPLPALNTTPPSPVSTMPSPSPFFEDSESSFEDSSSDSDMLLPDPSWIAIVCGVSKEQWQENNGGDDEGMPENFFLAPRDVYMPDLTAVADVLLGKLGYGTVSECVDASTPFVYVSRPLFIEEHGLRLLLDRDGAGVELSREGYESGEWAEAVQQAYIKGLPLKLSKRERGEEDLKKRKLEGRNMAMEVVSWVKDVWA